MLPQASINRGCIRSGSPTTWRSRASEGFLRWSRHFPAKQSRYLLSVVFICCLHLLLVCCLDLYKTLVRSIFFFFFFCLLNLFIRRPLIFHYLPFHAPHLPQILYLSPSAFLPRFSFGSWHLLRPFKRLLSLLARFACELSLAYCIAVITLGHTGATLGRRKKIGSSCLEGGKR